MENTRLRPRLSKANKKALTRRHPKKQTPVPDIHAFYSRRLPQFLKSLSLLSYKSFSCLQVPVANGAETFRSNNQSDTRTGVMRPTHFPFKRAPSSPTTTSSHLLPFGRASFILKEIPFFVFFQLNIRNLSWLPLRSGNASTKLKYCKARQTTMRKRLECFPSNLPMSYYTKKWFNGF